MATNELVADLCPCESGKSFKECCEELLLGTRQAATAEELMRSRYTAHARNNIDYIVETIHPDKRSDHDREYIEEWASSSDWRGLEVLSIAGGGADDDRGEVEFVARFAVQGTELRHHEKASFAKVDGRWYLEDGVPVRQEPVRREGPRIGRNDPCPCGSGKKFKKCCGAPGRS